MTLKIDQWYNREERSWVTMIKDERGYQIGPSFYDGHRNDAAASKRLLRARIADGTFAAEHATELSDFND